MICKNCGVKVPSGKTKCMVCGTPVPVETAPQNLAQNNLGQGGFSPVATAASSPAPARFCHQCGAKVPQDNKFCGNCGATLASAQPAQETPAYTAPATPVYTVPATPVYTAPAAPAYTPSASYSPKKKNHSGLIIGIVVTLIIAALIGGLVYWLIDDGFFDDKDSEGSSQSEKDSGDAEKTAKGFLDAVFSGDGEDIVDLIPDDVIEASGVSRKDFAKYFDNLIAQVTGGFGDFDYSVKIKKETEVTGEDFEDIQEFYEKECSMSIDEAKRLTVSFTIEAEGETVEDQMIIPVIKIGKYYYLDLYSFNVLYT